MSSWSLQSKTETEAEAEAEPEPEPEPEPEAEPEAEAEAEGKKHSHFIGSLVADVPKRVPTHYLSEICTIQKGTNKYAESH